MNIADAECESHTCGPGGWCALSMIQPTMPLLGMTSLLYNYDSSIGTSQCHWWSARYIVGLAT